MTEHSTTLSPIEIALVDFDNPLQREGVVAMVNAYASDPQVGGVNLPAAVLKSLGERLAEHPTAVAWLATEGETPVGVLVGFFGFSTFAARPLLNLHDLAVVASRRGRGIGRTLLTTAEAYARERDCCAMTLEVRGDNFTAQRLYRQMGFDVAERVEPPTSFAFCKKLLE